MSRSCFLRVLLISSLLILSFTTGFGRKLTETFKPECHSTARVEGDVKESRVMIQVTDYAETEPNINPINGYLMVPPPEIDEGNLP